MSRWPNVACTNKLLNAWVWKIIFNCDQGFFLGVEMSPLGGKKKRGCNLFKGFFCEETTTSPYSEENKKKVEFTLFGP
jgi:hypothetical protein